ncbi:adenylate kinase [Verrucomicrobiota bacterium]
MEAIILLGAPGAGKGTLAEKIKARAEYIHVSTGDMLRAAIRNQTEVGMQAKAFMDRGELVPDEVIVGIIKERLSEEGADAKFMFDGFPRTLEQAKALDGLLGELGGNLTDVLLLNVAPEVVVGRLTGRRSCKACGAVYHIVGLPPKVEGVCDACGGELYQRDDDKEETILNRLSVFNGSTAPLVEYYESKNVLYKLDAANTPDAIAEEVMNQLQV